MTRTAVTTEILLRARVASEAAPRGPSRISLRVVLEPLVEGGSPPRRRAR